jgi:hypothetical protein
VFRFVYKGATVDWWDWGSRDQALTQTVVTVESIAFGSVVNPADNGGRPLIVIQPLTRSSLILLVRRTLATNLHTVSMFKDMHLMT